MKTLLLFILAWLGATEAIAQTQYYESTQTFYENNYTYQCDVPASGMVTLYNKNNKLTYVDCVYKATNKYYAPEPWEFISPLKNDKQLTLLYQYIVNNAFSLAERSSIQGNKFAITMYIDPETGKVTEVDFRFTTFSPYMTIPLTVYREIETELKSKIKFEVTSEGKRLNYIKLNWHQEPQNPIHPAILKSSEPE